MIENVRLNPAGTHVVWDNSDGVRTRPADQLLIHVLAERDQARAALRAANQQITDFIAAREDA